MHVRAAGSRGRGDRFGCGCDRDAYGVKAAVKGATMNVRGGPGTTFPVIASAKKGQSFDVQGKTKDGAWLQLCCLSGKPGWASASLVTATGDLKKVLGARGAADPTPGRQASR